jgi:hypothetical protein
VSKNTVVFRTKILRYTVEGNSLLPSTTTHTHTHTHPNPFSPSWTLYFLYLFTVRCIYLTKLRPQKSVQKWYVLFLGHSQLKVKLFSLHLGFFPPSYQLEMHMADSTSFMYVRYHLGIREEQGGTGSIKALPP